MKMRIIDQYGFGTVELLAIGMVVIVLVVVGIVLYTRDHNTNASNTTQTNQGVLSKFVTAMGDVNSNVVASLESTQFKNWMENSTTAQKNTKGEQGAVITNNFYDLEKQNGGLGIFKSQFLDGARIKTGAYLGGLYEPTKGTTGISETYDTKTNNYGAPAYSPSFTVDAVRSGNSWLVDNVGFYAASTDAVTP